MSALTIDVRASAFAELVKPIIPLASPDGMLPILNAVKVETRGEYMTATATDRFRVGISRIKPDGPTPAGFNALIRLSELRQMLTIFKATKNNDPILTLTLEITDDHTSRLRVTQSGGFNFIDASMTFGLMTGDYPRTAPLFTSFAKNTSEPAALVGMNAAYLADFRHALRNRSDTLVIHAANANKPTIVTVHDYFIGAIMPVSVNADDSNATKWVAFLTDKKTAKDAA